MKSVKRSLCLLLALALAFTLCACSLTPRMAVSMQKMGKVKSLHSDTTVEIEASLSFLGEEMPLSFAMRILGDQQRDPAMGSYEMSMTAMGVTQKMLLCSAQEEDGSVTVYLSPDGGKSWEKKSVDPRAYAESAESTPELNIGNVLKLGVSLASLFEEAGTVDLPGGRGVVYEGTIPPEILQELLRRAAASEKLKAVFPIELDEELLATVGGVPVRLVVDEQSDMPVRLEADLTEAMAGIVPGIVQQVMDRFGLPGEGMAITVSKLAVSTALSDFDEAVVTLPADIAA